MSENKINKLSVSFLYGYSEIDLTLEAFPILLVCNGKLNCTYNCSYKSISDFLYYNDILKGKSPLKRE